MRSVKNRLIFGLIDLNSTINFKANMEIFVQDNYDLLSKKAAATLIDLAGAISDPVVCFASGDSPSGMYREIIHLVKSKKLDVSSWYFIGLDEWAGMNGDDEGSCRYHLNQQLFQPLKIKHDRICFFNGRAREPLQECLQTENFIREHGGIDVAVVGLGMNGHVGMNEPGTSLSSRSYYADIHPLTQKTGQKYFKEEQDLSHGLTLGIGTLMEARAVILLANGSNKSEIVKKMVEGEISEEVPATLFRNHSGLSIFLDREAAQLLSNDSGT